MSGSAGCGYEFRNVGMCCGNLTSDLIGFSCIKYKETLNKFPRTGDPIRLKKCADDAGKHWDSEHAKQRITSKSLLRHSASQAAQHNNPDVF